MQNCFQFFVEIFSRSGTWQKQWESTRKKAVGGKWMKCCIVIVKKNIVVQT
jgi:hypothetical protein